jgi:integrase
MDSHTGSLAVMAKPTPTAADLETIKQALAVLKDYGAAPDKLAELMQQLDAASQNFNDHLDDVETILRSGDAGTITKQLDAAKQDFLDHIDDATTILRSGGMVDAGTVTPARKLRSKESVGRQKVFFTDKWLRAVAIPETGSQSYFEKLTKSRGGPSLVLTVYASGRRAWRVMSYDENSKSHIETLPGTYSPGAVDHMGIAAARKLAVKHVPKARPDKTAAKSTELTFEAIAESWWRHVLDTKLRSAPRLRRHLDSYILPKLGKKPVSQITTADIDNLAREVQRKAALSPRRSRSKGLDPGATSADRTLTLLSAIFKWHSLDATGVFVSPVVTQKQKRDQRTTAEKARDRILTDGTPDEKTGLPTPREVQALWAATGDSVYGGFVRMLLLTGQRQAKVQSMKWSDLVGDTWVVATEPREKGNVGAVKLPSLAMKIINDQPRIEGNPYVFPGSRGGGPLTDLHKFKRKLDARMSALLGSPIERWTLHDIRRSFRTMLSEMGVDFMLAEMLIGHAVKTSLQKTYDRSNHSKAKAEVLQQVADRVTALVEARSDQ